MYSCIYLLYLCVILLRYGSNGLLQCLHGFIYEDGLVEVSDKSCSHFDTYTLAINTANGTIYKNVTYSNHKLSEKNKVHYKDVEHCLAFKYFPDENSPDSYKVDFMCDFELHCNGKNELEPTDAVINGHFGRIMCCSDDFCLTPEMGQGMAPHNISCYTGVTGHLEKQLCHTRNCLVQHIDNITHHSCDFDNICDVLDIPNKEQATITRDGESLETDYCCNTDDCNAAMYKHYTLGTIPPPHPDTTVGSMVPMDSDVMPHDDEHKRTVFITGCVSAAILAVLSLVAVILIIHRCKQRQRLDATFTYAQLNAETELLDEQQDRKEKVLIVG